jgi:hypothetical protein
MKRKIILILLVILIPLTIYAREIGGKKKIVFSVIDSRSEKPVPDAQVTVVKIQNARDINTEMKNTDSRGRCSFILEFNPEMQYNVMVQKNGRYPCYSVDSAGDRTSFRNGISREAREIRLYLSSDSTELIRFYSQITPHIPVDTLIAMLKADRYIAENRLCLPELGWKDIPRLLAIGNDQGKVTRFPQNPISSDMKKDCYIGTLALWMIESIRISEGKTLISPHERFPSQFPAFKARFSNKETPIYGKMNSPQTLKTAYLLYVLWWKKTRNMDRKEAAKIDPLANSEIAW